MKKVKVYLDSHSGGRKIVEADFVGETATTVRVRLSDGNVIRRKKARDLPKESSDETV